jgi:hypothetical protein
MAGITVVAAARILLTNSLKWRATIGARKEHPLPYVPPRRSNQGTGDSQVVMPPLPIYLSGNFQSKKCRSNCRVKIQTCSTLLKHHAIRTLLFQNEISMPNYYNRRRYSTPGSAFVNKEKLEHYLFECSSKDVEFGTVPRIP